jgi:hypothetical protein
MKPKSVVRAWVAGAVVWMWCMAGAAMGAMNLVVNPGFEDGVDEFARPVGWDFAGGPTPDSGVDTSSSSHGGTQTFYFVAVEPSDRISQALTTSSGQNYLVSFWLGNTVIGSDGIVASWEGATLLSIGPTTSEFGWTQYSFTVTAAGSASVLAFDGFDGDGAIMLDDVSVTTVPCPSSPALLSLGSLGMLRRARRR